MRRILAVLCILSLTGCQALTDTANFAVDAVKSPGTAIHGALEQVINFIVTLGIQFITTLFAPYLTFLGF